MAFNKCRFHAHLIGGKSAHWSMLPLTQRRARFAPLAVLSALLVCSPWASAQQGQAIPARPATSETPKPLSQADENSLQRTFVKTRPASLRLEQCPTAPGASCAEPDGLGSAVVIESGPNGTLALTAYHVVFGARKLEAVTLDKSRYPVTVIGYDDGHDVALLKLNVPAGKTLPTLPLALNRPKIGQSALAIGNGGGAFLTAKTGRLTALDVTAERASFPSGTLELDAKLIPGDSGGPILNAQGEVMGIISYISARATPFGIATRSSYAVPVTRNDGLLGELRSGLKRDAPVIGLLSAGDIAEQYFEPLGLGKLPGAVFTSVTKGSPAEQIGLRPLKPLSTDEYGTPTKLSGDVITAINGVRILSFDDLLSAVRARQVGDVIQLSVVRDGKPIPDLNLKLGPRTLTADPPR